MKIVNMSKRKFNNLNKLVLSKEIMNTEGSLYLVNQNGENKVFKMLRYMDDDIYSNKLYTISSLYNNRDYLPDDLCLPEKFVSVDDNIVGYLMPYISGDNLNTILKDEKIKPVDKIKYFKQIGILLEKLEQIRKYSEINDIYLNDIHESNFMVDRNDKIHMVDIDSVKIGNNVASFSRYLMPSGLVKYAPLKYKTLKDFETCNPTKNTDLYCYNIMILNYLYGDNSLAFGNLSEYYKYLNYLEDIGMDKKIVDSFSRLVVNTQNINPYFYLENITNENVYRANSRVYKKVVR